MPVDEHKVERVSKEAALRDLNDQEKQLHAEEREAREQFQRQDPKDPDNTSPQDSEKDPEELSVHQQLEQTGHFDTYV